MKDKKLIIEFKQFRNQDHQAVEKKKIRIQRVSTWSIIVTIVLAVIFAAVSVSSEKEFQVLRQTTDEYILCQNSAKELQDGSDYLTEQVRMYAMTGKTEYRDLYFEEANTTRRREKALEELKKYFADTDSFTALETALSRLQELMETEYYSMRLVAESYGKSEESLLEEIPGQVTDYMHTEGITPEMIAR